MSCNKLVVCPYDEVHKVKESRLSLHITKCRQNHLDEQKFTCPFNATHILPYQERNYHLLHCADRAPLDRAITHNELERNNPFKGHTAVPSYTESMPTVTDEVWDDEISEPAPGYVASGPPPCAIIEPPPLSKPAERRKLYQELHRMPTESENRNCNQTTDSATVKTNQQLNRQPKAPSQIENKKYGQNEFGLGLGRGRPVAAAVTPAAPPSRIAANIFPPNPEVQASTLNGAANYSAALSTGMSNLGLGRGFSANIANDDSIDDEQFPALGCGRGIYRPKKNGVRYPGSRS